MKIFPDFEQFQTNYLSKTAQLAWSILPADLETPVSVALKLQNEKYLSLFESVEGGHHRARYSFITLDPDLIWTCDKNTAKISYPETGTEEIVAKKGAEIFPSLRKLINSCAIEIPAGLPPMSSGLFGYMGYDMVRYMENIPDKHTDTIGIPESIFIRPRLVIVFDSVKDEMIILTSVMPSDKAVEAAYQEAGRRICELVGHLEGAVSKAPCSPLSLRERADSSNFPLEKLVRNPGEGNAPQQNINSPHPTPLPQGEGIPINLESISNTSRAEYYKMVEKAKEYIVAGDIFQVVLAQRFTVDFPRAPFSLYRKLRRLNPSPFSFYMQMDGFCLVGSSPEILVRVREGNVTVRPIAGTRPRGKDRLEDEALEKDLLADAKELSEHLMLIDLGRNDVGRVAQIGSVKVTDKMIIERYSHVMHIVSNVEGRIGDGFDGVDAVIAGFPVGTVSGAPKIRAMEIIDELEKARRSFYAGGVGYFSSGGDVDMCIALRTGLVKDNKLYIQAGGGVVLDSSAEGEYTESCNKARALVRAAEMVMEE